MFFFFSLSSGYAQIDDKSSFKEKFLEANYHIEYENYALAIPIFTELVAMDPDNANINYKIGYCYIKANRNKAEAGSYLEKAAQNTTGNYDDLNPLEKKAPLTAYYYLGMVYHLSYKLDEAIATFEKFKSSVGKKHYLIEDANRQIAMCNNAKEFMATPTNVVIDNLGDSINSSAPDFSPVISIDEATLIFTTRRPLSPDALTEVDGQYFEDIYISTKDKNGVWAGAKPIGDNINTTDHEAAIGLSADGQTLFIYKGEEGGSLHMSELVDDEWSVPMKLGSNINTEHWETHAALSSDSRFIYFTSNRPGGFGGRDIYMCKRLPNGQWALAQNLGPTINTKYDEDAPFIHPDGKTIYFSSQGHKSMGGFDIFFTEINEDGSWGAPVNMGYPINTTDDDVFYVTSADGKRAYYSTITDGGLGEKDLYVISLVDAEEKAVTVLKGKITLDGDEKLPKGVLAFVRDIESGIVVNECRPNSKAEYTFALEPGKTYTISYEADGFDPILDTIIIEAGTGYQEIEKELFLRPINFESKALGSISLSGTIKNKEGELISGAQINVVDNATGEEVGTFKTMNNTDLYYFILQLGQNYNISFEAEGYLFHSENVNIPKKPEYAEIKKDVVMERIEAGTKIVLNNIFFDHNKSVLRKESNVELEKLYKVMAENPEMIIEVGGHTDSKGNADINMKLSKARAQAVVNYLSNKGVSTSRLIAKGYGKDKPIAPNNLPNGKPNPEGMQLNRRVEFEILDYKKPVSKQTTGENVKTGDGNTLTNNQRKDLLTKEISYTTQSPLYGVQIGAYQKSLPSNDFENVKNVHSFLDKDGMVRYVIGSFVVRNQAETLKKAVVEAGYKDAFIVDVNKEKKFSTEVVHYKNPVVNGKVSYSVQVGAYSTTITAEAAKSMLEVADIVEIPQGDLTLLTVGSFNDFESAEKLKNELVGKGVKEAFIIAFLDGKKISLQEAKEYSGKK